eukprot:1145341-Pelagomonas_calceolata.AAC.2
MRCPPPPPRAPTLLCFVLAPSALAAFLEGHWGAAAAGEAMVGVGRGAGKRPGVVAGLPCSCRFTEGRGQRKVESAAIVPELNPEKSCIFAMD